MLACLSHRLPVTGKQVGRPRVVGQRLPNLEQVAHQPSTLWHRSQFDWYGGGRRVLDWTSGTALWYSTGTRPSADPLGVGA